MLLESSPVTSWNEEIKRPQIHPTAYIHQTAVIIGDVRIEKNVIVCPGVVLRADEGSPIIIGEGSNIQDRVTMHCLKGSSIEVGKGCSIAHGAVLHGPCVIGEETFVGFNSVVLDARLGEGCFVSHCALVNGVSLPPATKVPAGRMLQHQEEVDHLPIAEEKDTSFTKKVLDVNGELCRGYRNMNHIDLHHYDHHQEHKARIKKGWVIMDEKEAIG